MSGGFQSLANFKNKIVFNHGWVSDRFPLGRMSGGLLNCTLGGGEGRDMPLQLVLEALC